MAAPGCPAHKGCCFQQRGSQEPFHKPHTLPSSSLKCRYWPCVVGGRGSIWHSLKHELRNVFTVSPCIKGVEGRESSCQSHYRWNKHMDTEIHMYSCTRAHAHTHTRTHPHTHKSFQGETENNVLQLQPTAAVVLMCACYTGAAIITMNSTH